MSLGITQTIGSAMPVVSAACFIAAGAFAGRKVICGIACKAAALAADAMGKQNELHETSAAYFAKAKADAPRDFAAATGLVLTGLFAKHAGETLKAIPPKPEPTKYEKYIAPVIGFVVDYKKPIVGGVIALTILAGIKKLYSNPATPVTKSNFKIIKKVFDKTKDIQDPIKTVIQEPLKGAYSQVTNTPKLPPTILNQKLAILDKEFEKVIFTEHKIVPSNYEIKMPSFAEMKAAYQFNT